MGYHMGILPTSAYTAPSLIGNPSQHRKISAADTAMFAASATTTADTTTISKAARDRAREETLGGPTYDFSSMSPNDILPTINSLIKSGQMSLDESDSLILLVPISLGSDPVPAVLSQKINLFSALEDWLSFHKYLHNDVAAEADQRAISALRRIQASDRTEG